MAVVEGSILELRVFQLYQGQQILNVCHFQVAARFGGGAGLNGYAEVAGLEFYNTFNSQQSIMLQYVRAELHEVNGIYFDQFAFEAGSYLGAGGGEGMPPFVSYGIRLNRNTKITRNGAKRIGGVPESTVNNGLVVNAVRESLQMAAASYFVGESVWTDPDNAEMSLVVNPIIWGGNDPQYPMGRFSDIVGVEVSSYATTQNTRKVRASVGT